MKKIYTLSDGRRPMSSAFADRSENTVKAKLARFAFASFCFLLLFQSNPIQAQITGIVYRDFNSNGLMEEFENGVGGIPISAVDQEGNEASTVTASNGTYLLDFDGCNGSVRVDFDLDAFNAQNENSGDDIFPGYANKVGDGTGNQSNTRTAFVNCASTSVLLGVNTPNDYCGSEPLMVVPCYIAGDPLAGCDAIDDVDCSALGDVLVGFQYSASGDAEPDDLDHLALSGDIGAVWGVAYQRETAQFFAAAVNRSHAGFGPLGTGGIYKFNLENGLDNPPISNFFDLNGCENINTGPDLHAALPANKTVPVRDIDSGVAAGKNGLGGMTISSTGEDLWVVNLHEKSLHQIRINNPSDLVITCDAIETFEIPSPCGIDLDFRPWAVREHHGNLYVGMVCTNESGNGEFFASVQKFTPPSTWEEVLQVELDYTKGYSQATFGDKWEAWTSDLPPDTLGAVIFPQPMLTDIAFEGDGSMIVALMDRSGLQVGFENYLYPFPDNGLYSVFAAGDLLRAQIDHATGSWQLESNGMFLGIDGAPVGCGAGNGEGPGGGEFYCGDRWENGTHEETSLGGLAVLFGSGEIVSSALDPTTSPNSGGVQKYSILDGSNDLTDETGNSDDFAVYSEIDAGTFGKATGIGGVSLLCDVAPIEVGNRVWIDQNANGIQDPEEAGVPDIEVQLLDNAMMVVGTTTTANDGTFYFNEGNLEESISPNSDYQIRILGSNFDAGEAFEGLGLVSSATDNIYIDSDASLDGPSGDIVIDFTTGDNGQNNHSLDFGFAEATASLTIAKTVSQEMAFLGDQLTYNITLTNDGDEDVTGVVVIDELPLGVSYEIASATAGEFDSATGEWNVGIIPTGGSQSIDLVVEIQEIGNWVNVATIAESDQELTGDISSTATFDALPLVNLSVEKTVNVESAEVGDQVVYTITAQNEGPSDATGIVIQDMLPSQLEFFDADPTAGDFNGGIWNLGSLVNGGVEVLTLTATVLEAGEIVNTAALTEVNEENSSTNDSDTATIGGGGGEVNLNLSKTADVSSIAAGDQFQYEISIENTSSTIATGVMVTDQLPDEVSVVAASSDFGDFDSSTGVWTIGTIGAGQELELIVVVEALENGPITNVASITALDQTDEDGDEDHSSTVTTEAASEFIDLELDKKVDFALVSVGEMITYTLTVTNESDLIATSVTVQDLLPAEVSYVSSSASMGSYDEPIWTVGTVASGTMAELEIVVEVIAEGTFLNSAEISFANEPDVDSTPNNNDDQEDDQDGVFVATTTAPDPTVDLSLTKTASETLVNVGDQFVYTIIVTNSGELNATGILIEDVLPQSVQYISHEETDGIFSFDTGLWNIDEITASGNEVLSITVEMLEEGFITNIAEVIAVDQDDADSTPGNNIPSEDDQDQVTVGSESMIDLELTKTVDAESSMPGAQVSFTIVVNNNGMNTATGIQVADQLIEEFVLVGSDASQGSYADGIWLIDELEAGQEAELTIDVEINGLGSLTNVAQVIAHNEMDIDSEPNNGLPEEDDQDDAIVFSAAGPDVADLSLTKTVDVNMAEVGESVNWTLTVTNEGSLDLTGVVVEDQLPAGLTVTNVEGDGSFDTGSWGIGDIASGASVVIVITTELGNDLIVGDVLTNTAEVTAMSEEDVDSTPGNGNETEDDYDSASITVGGEIEPPVVGCPDTLSFCTVPLTKIEFCLPNCVDDGAITEAISTFGCSITIENDTCISYLPLPAFLGEDSVILIICEPMLQICDTVFVQVYVGDDCGPITEPDNVCIIPGESILIDVLGNDSHPSGLDLFLTEVTSASFGQVVIQDGQILYSSAPTFVNGDSFTYTVCDEAGVCDENFVVIDLCDDDCEADFGTITPPVTTSISSGGIVGAPLVEGNNTDPGFVFMYVLAYDLDPTDDVEYNFLAANSTGTFNFGALMLPDGTYYVQAISFEGTNEELNEYHSAEEIQAAILDGACIDFFFNGYEVTVGETEECSDELEVCALQGEPIELCPLWCIDGMVVIDTAITTFNCSINYDDETDCITYIALPGNLDGTPDSVILVGCNEFMVCDTFVFQVTIGCIEPEANPDEFTIPAGVETPLNIVANDLDPCGNPFSVTEITQPAEGGTASLVDGVVSFTPDDDFEGTTTFTYTICNECIGADGDIVSQKCDETTVTITVEGEMVATPLDAEPDIIFTPINMAIEIDVLSNDNGDGLMITDFTQPENGTVTYNADGTALIYTPNEDFEGTDYFFYTVCDENGDCETTIVAVNVFDGPNMAPMAGNDQVTTDVDTPVVIDVLNNDSDPEGGPLVLDTILNGPMNGTVTINPDGTITYTPDPGFMGEDSFDYVVCDEEVPPACDTGTVVIAVGVDLSNDPPVAVSDTVFTDVDQSVIYDVTVNDFDPNGDNITVKLGSQPQNGEAAVEGDLIFYNPYPGFVGEDYITYIICDDGNPSLADTAYVWFIVGDAITPIDAEPDIIQTPINTPIDIFVLMNDDGNELEIKWFTEPLFGILVGVPENDPQYFVYVPGIDYTGTDYFCYAISDALGDCDTTKVEVTVFDPGGDNIFPPNANNDQAVTDPGAPVTIPVLNNDSDPEGGVITIDTILNGPMNGMVMINPDGTITYTPDPDFMGEDFFDYVICDDGSPADSTMILCDTATVVIAVGVDLTNDPPIAVDDFEMTDVNQVQMFDILANDSDPNGDNFAITYYTDPLHGMVVVDPNGEVTYIPDTDYQGVDWFIYVICDDGVPVLCDTAYVEILIGTPDMPGPPATDINAEPDVISTPVDTPIEIDILANDTGDEIEIKWVGDPSFGTVEETLDMSLIYTPDAGFIGVDYFMYAIIDSAGGCDTTLVSVTVLDPELGNLPPIADSDVVVTPQDSCIIIDVLANDIDPENDTLIIIGIDLTAEGGTATLNMDGTILYCPPAGFTGLDFFNYIVCDEFLPAGLCDTAQVVIAVGDSSALVNTAPTALVPNDCIMVTENDSISLNLTQLVSDPDANDNLGIDICSDPTFGDIVFDPATGILNYKPFAGFFGQDFITFKVCDDGLPPLCDTAWVEFCVMEDTMNMNSDLVNAVNDTVSVLANMGPFDTNNIDIDVLSNDTPNTGECEILVVTAPLNGTFFSDGVGIINYAPDEDFEGLDSLQYMLCCNNGLLCDTAWVFINVQGCDIQVKNGISPNNDGFNDYFDIPFLFECYGANEPVMLIYNRWGNLVYEKDNYTGFNDASSWTGKWQSNGEDVPDGTYFYILKLNTGNSDEDLAGFIEVLR